MQETSTIFISASFFSGWRGSLNVPGKHSIYVKAALTRSAINRLGGPAICNTYSLRTPGWRQYWSALMLVTTSTNTSSFLNGCKAIDASKQKIQITGSKLKVY